MREIDPQSEARLKEALQRMAAASSQAVPAGLRTELLGQFRRHHARRRWTRRGGVLALAACLVLAAIWSSRSLTHRRSGQDNLVKAVPTDKENVAAPTTRSPQRTQNRPSESVVAAEAKQTSKTPVRPRSMRPAAIAANRPFLALPAYDPTVPVEDLQVVRVQLPASALWKIGAPVPADADERRMTADFVVGQDGTAYAVRLVQ
jgi:hypothetical protein